MTDAFVLRESKRLSFLINTRLHTGTEAHVIIQSKVICKNTSKHAVIALNRKGEERKEMSMCMSREREQLNQTAEYL